MSPNRQKDLIAIFFDQIESQIFSCHLLRGTLRNWSDTFTEIILELRPRSILRGDFTRNSLSKCVSEFIIRKLLGAFFFKRTQEIFFHFQTQQQLCLLCAFMNTELYEWYGSFPFWPSLLESSKGKIRACVLPSSENCMAYVYVLCLPRVNISCIYFLYFNIFSIAFIILPYCFFCNKLGICVNKHKNNYEKWMHVQRRATWKASF